MVVNEGLSGYSYDEAIAKLVEQEKEITQLKTNVERCNIGYRELKKGLIDIQDKAQDIINKVCEVL